METTTLPSTAGIALKWGGITGVASIIYNTLLRVTGLATNQALSYVGFIFLIGGIVYAMREFRAQNGGFLSYGQGLGVGTLTCGVAGLLSSAFTAIYTAFIDDSWITSTMKMQRAALEKQGMEDAQIDQALGMAQKFMSPGVLFVTGLLGSLLVGLILSLIIAAIMKKDRPETGF